MNGALDACLGTHLGTPPPSFRSLPLPEGIGPSPVAPVWRLPTLLDQLLFRRRRIESENAALAHAHAEAFARWQAQRDTAAAERLEVEAFEASIHAGVPAAMERHLADRLAAIAWARETLVSFDFGDDGCTLDLDIDLPEPEDLPSRTASMPARGIDLRIHKRTDAQRRKDFLRLVAGTCFRAAGEDFAALPTLRELTVSGYAQEPDPATGKQRDTYVVSVRIPRAEWEAIAFDNLEAVEPETALAAFDLRLDAGRGGRLAEIVPHGLCLSREGEPGGGARDAVAEARDEGRSQY